MTSSTTTPTKLHVVHYWLAIDLKTGGVVRAVLDLCNATANAQHQVTLLTSDTRDIPPEWHTDAPHTNASNTPTAILLPGPLNPGRRLSPEALQTAEDIFKTADVVHLHTPWELSNIQLSKILRRLKIPYVVTIHGMLDDWSMQQRAWKKKLFLTLVGHTFLSNAATIHLTAEAERTQATRYVPSIAQNGIVTPLVFDLEPYKNLPSQQQAQEILAAYNFKTPLLLFLSRIHPKKGPALLVEAAAILKNKGLSFQIVLAGPDEENHQQELEKRIAELGLENEILFIGMIRDQAKIALYTLADLFVLPTHQENFGLVLVEALACETAVVTTQGTDIWHELQAAGAKIVSHQAEEIAATLQQLLSDPKQTATLGVEGRAHVFKWLDPKHLIQQYETMYYEAKT